MKESFGQNDLSPRVCLAVYKYSVSMRASHTMCDNNERQSSENDCASDFNPIFYGMTMLLDFILLFFHSFSFVFL